jgi:hypothetical protein
MGPPAVAPYCSNDGGGFATGGDGWKKFFAVSMVSRPKAYPVPWMKLVPAFSPRLTCTPGLHPNSALGFCWMLNSWMASMGRSVAASPAGA